MTRSKDSSGNVTRVESFALERFRGLNADMGLSGPKVIRDRWNTTLVYQGRDVALEVELDWRDLAVFVMLVRLYEGKVPPGGYAGPDGKRCRVYVEDVLQKHLPTVQVDIPRGEHLEQITPAYLEQQIGAFERLLTLTALSF